MLLNNKYSMPFWAYPIILQIIFKKNYWSIMKLLAAQWNNTRFISAAVADLKSFALNTGSSFTYLHLTTSLISFSLHTPEIFAPVTLGIRPFSFSAWRPLEKAFFRLLSYALGASPSRHLKCQNPSVLLCSWFYFIFTALLFLM